MDRIKVLSGRIRNPEDARAFLEFFDRKATGHVDLHFAGPGSKLTLPDDESLPFEIRRIEIFPDPDIPLQPSSVSYITPHSARADSAPIAMATGPLFDYPDVWQAVTDFAEQKKKGAIRLYVRQGVLYRWEELEPKESPKKKKRKNRGNRA